MLTINHIQVIDNTIGRVLESCRTALCWASIKHETAVVNAAYRVAEAKASAIGKAEDKVSDLQYAHYELSSYGDDIKVILQEKYKAALAALEQEIADKHDKLNAKLADAAQELVAATKAYDSVVNDAMDKLGVEVSA